MRRRWNHSADHPRFLVSQSGRLKCKTCGKEQPKRTFEDLHHFEGSDCLSPKAESKHS